MSLFARATFLTSANDMHQLPAATGAEVAFAGRSNAGKSSAINALANRSRLAFTSKTPGRTQLINYFSLGDDRYLVDLPGYGYAKVPDAVRQHWHRLLSIYLQTRESLCGMVLLMDIRHPLTTLDRQMLDWFAPTGRPVRILLTKADKLSRSQAMKTLHEVQRELVAYPHAAVQLFSSTARVGLEEAESAIAEWLRPATLDEGGGPHK